MTIEESIDYIKQHCNPDYPSGKTEWETAINMAIDALQKQIPERQRSNLLLCVTMELLHTKEFALIADTNLKKRISALIAESG